MGNERLQGLGEFGVFGEQRVFAGGFGNDVAAAEIGAAQFADALHLRQHFRRHIDPLADVVAPVAAPQARRQEYTAEREPAAFVQTLVQTTLQV